MKKQILLWAGLSGLVFLSGCQTNSSIKQATPEVKKFSVAGLESEPNEIRSLGNNFYSVTFPIDGDPGPVFYAEQVSYVFFNSKQICRCDSKGVSISDTGQYIVFRGAVYKGDDDLILYDVLNDKTTTLSSTYIGTPRMAEWQEAKRTVRLALEKELGNITLKYFNF